MNARIFIEAVFVLVKVEKSNCFNEFPKWGFKRELKRNATISTSVINKVSLINFILISLSSLKHICLQYSGTLHVNLFVQYLFHISLLCKCFVVPGNYCMDLWSNN
jgi:hypothetical protein